MAKYKDIAEELKKRILEGAYHPGNPLPDQTNMAKEFDTSRVTIQKALQILSAEGLTYSKQGSGTYVKRNALASREMDTAADEFLGSTNKYGGEKRLKSQIIRFEVRFPTPDECEKLLISRVSPIYDIIRLRILDGEPHDLEYTLMPVEVIPSLTEEVLYRSIYNYIKKDLKLVMGGMNRKIRADKPDDNDRKYLDCREDDPVLEVEQVVYLDNGLPFEYSRTRHRYDKGDIFVNSVNR